MITVKAVHPKSCRGIADGPELRCGSDGAVIFGDNGTGKSSYIDAFEVALSGKCGSLDTGDAETSWGKQGGHILGAQPQVRVTLTDGSQDYDVDLGSPAAGPCVDYESAAREGRFILRRRAMLDFILSKPAERYKALESFLDVRAFQLTEDAVKSMLSRVEGALALTQNDLGTVSGELYSISDQPLPERTVNGLVKRVNEKLKAEGIGTITDPTGALSAVRVLDERLAKVGNVQEMAGLSNLAQALRELPSLDSLVAKAHRVLHAQMGLTQAIQVAHGHCDPRCSRKGIGILSRSAS